MTDRRHLAKCAECHTPFLILRLSGFCGAPTNDVPCPFAVKDTK